MTQQINLYDPAFLRVNAVLVPGALLAYACAAVIAVALAAAYAAGGQRARLEREAAAIDAQIKAEQERAKTLAAQKAARRKDAVLDAEAARLEAMLRARREDLAVLASGSLGSTGGFSEHMRALARQSMDGLWLTGLNISAGGGDIVLRGGMLDAGLLPRYLERLGREKAFEGRGFGSLTVGVPRRGPAEADATYLAFEIATTGASARAAAPSSARSGK